MIVAPPLLIFPKRNTQDRRELSSFSNDGIELDKVVSLRIKYTELVNELRGNQTMKWGYSGAVLDRPAYQLNPTPGATLLSHV